MACLGIAKPAVAPLIDIDQGEVYVFQGDKLTQADAVTPDCGMPI